MSQDEKDFLCLVHWPAVLDRMQAGWALGFKPHEIDILTRRGLLVPLGKPAPCARKSYACHEIMRLRQDLKWLDRARRAVSEFWFDKNNSR